MKLPTIASRTLGKSSLFWKKNGATVLTGVGVASVPAAIGLTVYATVKLCEALPDIKKFIAETETNARDNGLDNKAVKQEVAKAQLKVAGQFIKVYSPALVAGGVSVTCLLVSHKMMRAREAQLIGAFVALESAFKAYRSRVAEKIGVEEELALFRQPAVQFLDPDGDEGAPCIIDFDATQPSIYAKFFDESSTLWSANPEYNLMNLRNMQNSANDRLKAHGHVFLNEVYEMLGFKPTQAGQIVGWLADANERGTGDGFIDFGIYQIHDENNRAFVNGLEHTVGLDFNCDGVIISRI